MAEPGEHHAVDEDWTGQAWLKYETSSGLAG